MKKHYNPAIDILRILASLAVVLIHTSTKTLEASSYDLHRLSWTLFLNQIFRFAVPLFFMISGFVLELNYPFHASYMTYLKKRMVKILIPYLFWSSIYYFLIYTQHSSPFMTNLLTGEASYQLYFIPALIIFYIIFPFMHHHYKIFANRWLLIFLGISEVCLLYSEYYIHPLPFISPVRIALLNYFVFLLGIIASHHQEKIFLFMRKWKYIVFLVTVALGWYVFFEGKSGYFKTNSYLSFYSQWRPSVLFYTLFLGLSLYFLFMKYNRFPNVIKTLARLSLFVFFIHVIVLELLWRSWGKALFDGTNTRIAEHVWYDPLFFAVIASISFIIAYSIHKIPFAVKVTG